MLFLLSLIPFIILFIYNFKNSLHMAQQNLYNDDNRFLRWTINDFKSFKDSLKSLLIVLVTFFAIVLLKLEYSLLISIYFMIVSLIIFLLKKKETKRHDVKLKLKVTPRVKRLIITNLVILYGLL